MKAGLFRPARGWRRPISSPGRGIRPGSRPCPAAATASTASEFGLIRRFGRESTDDFIEDLAVDVARSLGAKLDRASETQAPAIGGASVQLGRDAALFSEIVFPLARDTQRVTQFLLASYEVRKRS